MNPGMPPNLDLQDGTLWRADVLFDVPAFEPGVAYGTLPEGALQRAPAQGTPEVLRSGSQYYLYALRDIAIPIAGCLFMAQ
jgi:hypothetical protein